MTLLAASSAGAAPLVEFADGTFKDQFRLTYVFTAENGKSVELFVADQQTFTGPTDNGDGTVTFTSTFKGIPEMWRIPNGPILIIDVGFVTFTDVVNLATDEVTTTIDPENGPHPELDSGFTLLCSVLVPALT
jgi:hypothetical protein